MADQVLRVKFVADGIGGFKADVASATGTVKLFRDAAANVGQSGAATSDLSAGMASIAAETRKARADMVAFLASSQIQKLGDDWKGFGDIVAASVAGRAAFSLAEFGLATKAAIVQQNAARAAALANAAALTAEHQAKVANFIATTAAGTASAAYTAALRAEVAQSLQATVAARAHAASLSATGGAFALLGGPAGAVALAAGSLAFFALSASSAGDEADKATKKNDALAASLNKVTAQALAARILGNTEALSKINSGNTAGATYLRDQIAADIKTIKDQKDAEARISDLLAGIEGKPGGKPKEVTKPPSVFKDEFTGQLKAYEDFQKTLFDVSDALNDQYAKLTLNEAEYYKYTLATKGLNKEQIDAAAALYDVNAALRASADDARKAADEGKALATVLDSIFPDEARGRKFAENFQLLAKSLKGAELDAASMALGKNFVDGEVAKKKASELQVAYEDAANGIRQSFRNTFRDVLENGVESFQDLGSKVADVFKDTLAELASAALTKNITIAVSGASGKGVSGTKDTATGAAAGAAGYYALAGLAVYGIVNSIRSGSDELRKQQELVAKQYSDLAKQVAAEIGIISHAADLGTYQLSLYGKAVHDAETALSAASWTAAAKAEAGLFSAIITRYDAEKKALDSVGESIKSIGTAASALRSQVSADAGKVLGLDDFRSPSAIASSASGLVGATKVPTSGSFLAAKADEARLAKLKTDIEFLLKPIYAGSDPIGAAAGRDQLRGRLQRENPSIDFSNQGAALTLVARQLATATETTARSQTAYLTSLDEFSRAASGNIGALSDLRQESLRWYDAQLKIASGLKSASQSIGGVLSSISLGQKTPGDQLKFLVDQFRNTDRSAGTGTDSQKADKLVSIGQSLVAQSGPILSLARELYGSTGGYTAIEELIRATLTDQKGVIDAATPNVENVQATTVSILGTIDTSLGSVKDTLDGTLKTIHTTIGELGTKTIEALKDILKQIGDTTGTASGGVEVSVVNSIDGVPITNAIVTTINKRLKNGEKVFVSTPDPQQTGRIQGGM